MGISLTEPNRVEIAEMCFGFPSFAKMRPAIRNILNNYVKLKRGKSALQIEKVLDDLFFRKCEYIENGDNSPGWKKKIDPVIRQSAASVFSDQLQTSLWEDGKTIRITVETRFGNVVFVFPDIEDCVFKASIAEVLLIAKARSEREHLKSYLDQQMRLFRSHCLEVEGIDGLGNDWKQAVPENWISAAIGRLLGGE